MKKFSVFYFWGFLFFIIFIFSFGYPYYILKIEKGYLNDIKEKVILNDISILKKELTIVFNNNNDSVNSDILLDIIDSNKYIEKLYIFKNGKNIFSSNAIYDEKFKKKLHNSIYYKDIDNNNINNKNIYYFHFSNNGIKYIVLLKFNLKKYFHNFKDINLYSVSFVSAFLIFIFFLFSFSFFIINPINTIIKKINDNNFSYSKFCLKEFDVLDKNIVNSFNIIQNNSYTDELTGLYNRKIFSQKIGELISDYTRHNIPFSFIIFDIDNFKHINDTYGHTTGDSVLIKISSVVNNLLRDSDNFFRIGGEEFVILLSATDIKEAKIVAEKVRKKVSDTYFLKEEHITISLGVTSVNYTDTMNSIYSRADTLLYQSKNQGKNTFTSS